MLLWQEPPCLPNSVLAQILGSRRGALLKQDHFAE